VSYGSETQVAEGLVDKAKANTKICCPKCGHDRPRRVEREGFMQKHVYSWFGYFPWHCRECKHYFMFRQRSRSKSTKKQYVERER
jgi:DNA-directed RNA polymerase subunit RPC12/RpoP